MTDKELRKLKRSELLEILFYLEKDVETLRRENEELKRLIAASSVSDEDIAKIARAVKYELKGGAPSNPSNKKKK